MIRRMEWSTRSADGGGHTSGSPASGGQTAGRSGSRGVAIGAGFVLVGAVALGALRFLGGSPVERDTQGALAAAALVAPYAAAAYLALVGRRDRPWLVAAAGTVLIPLSFVSFAGVTLPFLVAAAVFLRQGLGGPRRWRPAGVVTAFVAVLALVASVVLLFVHQDPATWETATGGGSTSDIVTTRESLRSLLVVTGAVGLATFVPPRP
jgi:hypothetical protein